MFFIFIILYILLYKIVFGKFVYVLGGNEKVVYILGIKLNKVKIIIYIILGIMVFIFGLIIILCFSLV